MTLKESALSALRAIGTWATTKEVYDYMVANNFELGTSKTPDASVSSVFVNADKKGIVVHKNRTKSLYEYGFLEWDAASGVSEETSQQETHREEFKERDLHQLLCNYLWQKGEYPKTIYQERSNRNDSAQKWVHPDMVSASFVEMKKPISEELLKATKANDAMVLCSYELKIRIKTDYDLKQAFFQALSNSNWANYGYLVVFELADNKDLMDEIERLNQSFGIGVIKLGIQPSETRVLYAARKNQLDYKTIDKLCDINPQFGSFIEQITKVLTAEKRYLADVKTTLTNICDTELKTVTEIASYCRRKNIPMI